MNWHERAAFQRSASGRSTAGNDVVATILISLFFSPLSSPLSVFSAVTFSHRRSARIKNLKAWLDCIVAGVELGFGQLLFS